MPFADVMIIGSGLSALIAAKRLGEEKNVIIFTKSSKFDSNSMLAQGGVAAAISEEDQWISHLLDTLTAGCEHNDEEAVQALVQQGPQALWNLISEGMNFDRDEHGNLLLGKEGAHHFRRILHAGGDATGKALVEFLMSKLPNTVRIMENEMALDLMVEGGRCTGVMTRNDNGNLSCYHAAHTIIATGGCGSMYSFTSNSPSTTGDGLAMAFRAGAELADLEFVQFHPTMAFVNGQCRGLVSEAVRGEGALLVDASGRRIMESVHRMAELAPRDIAAREIYREISGGKQVFLDISGVQNFSSRFPTITALCRQNGINLEEGLIPVVPGAHFMMGGIQTDLFGRTSLEGLYAVGEAACTGVHGANRLASNSLLEGIVFGRMLAEAVIQSDMPFSEAGVQHPGKMSISSPVLPAKKEIQEVMMKYCGIVRNRDGLEKAIHWFEQYKDLIFMDIDVNSFTNEQIEIRNMLTTGWLICTSALRRTESRGGHYRSDCPKQEDSLWLKKRIIRQKTEAAALLH